MPLKAQLQRSEPITCRRWIWRAGGSACRRGDQIGNGPARLPVIMNGKAFVFVSDLLRL